MTCQDAIARAVEILTARTINEETEEVTYTVTDLPVFPYYRKKDANLKEYIVVNTLGFPHDILQVGFVNVNIHIADNQGLIDNGRLYEIGDAVISAFDSNSPATQEDYIDFELENEQVFQGSNEDHYLSLKYKVAMLNN